ncbi:MAG: beta-ketoacyl-ACP synthase II [Planctomycetes bacterium]|nr:beta-ketoacyl-ACP synthase II [Planctomycetota bacterium]
MRRRVVITGLGTINSLSSDLEQFWQAICEGRSGVSPITSFDTTEYRVKFGGEVHDFDPEKYIDRKEANRLDRFAAFALAAAVVAVKDRGIVFSKEDLNNCGVVLGSGIGGLHEIEEQHTRLLEKGPSRISPFMIPKLMVNAASGQVSICFGLRGPNSAVATACASSSNAIGDAFKIIQRGIADVMVTGGSEAALTPMGLSGFVALRALSTRNDDPQSASRPFDADRDGFVLSEGSGILVLEDLDHARQRNARIYGEIIGYGMSADGNHITAPDPEGTGAAKSMSNALHDAELNPADIDYINAHGTSTPLGDVAETKAMKRVFGDLARKIPVSSTKSQVGHLLGASGAVELIVTILSIQREVIPPTINYHKPDPDCDLDYVPNTARDSKIRRAMSNSFGFGGHNTSLIVSGTNGL